MLIKKYFYWLTVQCNVQSYFSQTKACRDNCVISYKRSLMIFSKTKYVQKLETFGNNMHDAEQCGKENSNLSKLYPDFKHSVK